MDNIDMGFIDVPANYFELDIDSKYMLCVDLLAQMYDMLDKQLPIYISRHNFLNQVLDSSIETNLNDEMYEVVEVLQNMKQILNEP